MGTRKRLAAKAYARTAAYDAAISNWFAGALGETAPAYRAFGGKLIQTLRYGENPHQSAAFYRAPDQRAGVHETARYTSHVMMAADDSCVPGYRAPGDICQPFTAEGFALHPDWASGPEAWSAEGNPFLRVVAQLQNDLYFRCQGRAA